MDLRPIGNSGIKVAPVALGGNVFDWTADQATSFAVLDAFVDAGGTMIDTADVYSAWAPGHRGGESEALIGRWLKRNPAKRDKVVIATKVGFMAGLAPDTIEPSCDESLQRLGVETIDLYYQHKDDEAVPLADSLGMFDKLRRAGKIRAIGLSNFTAPRVEQALAVSAAQWLCSADRAAELVQSRRTREVRGAAAAMSRCAKGWHSSLTTASPTASSPANTARRETSAKAFAAQRTIKYLDGARA